MPDRQEPVWLRKHLQPGEGNLGMELSRYIPSDPPERQGQSPQRGLHVAWAVVRHPFWITVSGADIQLKCQPGGSLHLPHPSGVVIHPDSRMGADSSPINTY